MLGAFLNGFGVSLIVLNLILLPLMVGTIPTANVQLGCFGIGILIYSLFLLRKS